MYFKQFLHDDTGCASYFIASRTTREAIVIDPQYDVDDYLELAKQRGYTIVAAIDTHIHADHVSGNRRLPGASVYLHESAGVEYPFTPLRDGDSVAVGAVGLRAVHTPGHRPESISILVVNTDRSPEPSMVLSGDCLFVGDVGRPDFGGPAGALEEYESVQRLMALPDWVEVFPAHFEGSCGKSMCGRPSSTIGFERRYNPVLQLSRQAFLDLAAEKPARPLNMTAIMEMNRGLADHPWAAVTGHKEARNITVSEAAPWLKDHKPFVLDVREPDEYVAGHVPTAVSIPQADLGLRLPDVPQDREVLVVCAGGVRSARCASFLIATGRERITNLAGGTMAWKQAGYPLED
jgi:hydroxyacylglutathione hydrolase